MQRKYNIKKGRYKKATIRIERSGKVTLTIPLNWVTVDIRRLISSKRDWINKTLADFDEKASKTITPGHGEILYLGKIYRIIKNNTIGKTVKIDNDRLEIISGTDLNDPQIRAKFYKERSRFILIPRILKMAGEYGYKISKAAVRDTKRRWGSCSSKKVITLSERLIVAPIEVIDTIIIHELIHIEIMNHSKSFYKKLAELRPGYKDADFWLRERFPLNYP